MAEHSPNICPQFQQGNVLLISVLMLLAVSLMMLKALHYHLDNALIMMVDERRYLNAFQQAESSLVWGMAQSWSLHSDKTEEWYCQQQNEFYLTSCLKRQSSNFFLLKGVADVASGQSVGLYQWMKLVSYGGSDSLIPVESGWLDFCPEVDMGFCS
ncbi:YgdB family protein [Photorhabdus heterorhabditis]|uniref:YgdB family protein n=1 Tax=Photorhabdus heterorhabditis TaxID=880156 RepID=UPI001561B70D|nr:YgdB family protein [Photorhabdus heterorhabditis]NRN28348.1 YgdB family protein [Photorhabdus heterorhabditis subsp. aluminescens]